MYLGVVKKTRQKVPPYLLGGGLLIRCWHYDQPTQISTSLSVPLKTHCSGLPVTADLLAPLLRQLLTETAEPSTWLEGPLAPAMAAETVDGMDEKVGIYMEYTASCSPSYIWHIPTNKKSYIPIIVRYIIW